MPTIMQASVDMQLSPLASGLLQGAMTPRAAVQALLDAGESQAALQLSARLLPKRYAVAWVCQCAREEPLGLEDKAGLSLAEAWVRDPGEGNRRAAFEFANAGQYQSVGAWVAASAGWSGGSLAPAEQEQGVPPAEYLTARAVAAAVNMIAALAGADFVARRHAFIARALELLGREGAAGQA